MNHKKFFIALAVATLLLLILLLRKGLGSSATLSKNPQTATPSQVNSTNPDEVNLVSTSPSPLDGGTILPTQTISLTFDHPAENAPELKIKIDPQTDVNIDLSPDGKTVKITPKSSFGLNKGYVLTIPSEAKFQVKKTLGKDLQFNFSTINYQGV